MSDKPKINFILDIILFLFFLAITGIGFLLKYTLIAGREAKAKYGEMVDLTFLGLDRHRWGEIHFIVALVFLIILIIHIILHWNMILRQFEKLIKGSTVRKFVIAFFLILSFALIIFPFIINPEIHEKSYAQGHWRQGQQVGGDISSGDKVEPVFEQEENESTFNSEQYYKKSCRTCHIERKKLDKMSFEGFKGLLSKGHKGVTLNEDDKLKSLYNYIY